MGYRAAGSKPAAFFDEEWRKVEPVALHAFGFKGFRGRQVLGGWELERVGNRGKNKKP